MRSLVAVVLDRGSASPAEIVLSARKLCDVVFVCDGSRPDGAEALSAARELAAVCDVTGLTEAEAITAVARLQPDGITTFSEYQLRRTADLAAALDLPFHTPEVADVLTDKLRQRAVVNAAGVDATKCRVITDIDDLPVVLAEIGFPAIVKPRHGAGSTDTYRVRSLAEATAAVGAFFGAADDPRDFVVEEMLVGDPSIAGTEWGDYVSVESVATHGHIRHVCVTGKLPLAWPFRETGMVVPAALPAAWTQSVCDLADAAIRALGIRVGVTHTEIKLTADGPRLIEVNGRMGGYVSELIQRGSGYDLRRAVLEAALGRSVEPPPLTFTGVAYQYLLTAPPGATRLVRLAETSEILAVAGVRDVTVTARPGQPMGWRSGTEGKLGMVRGEATDHTSAAAGIAEIESLWRPVYE